MKSKIIDRNLALVAGGIFALGFTAAAAFAQGTAFTYQGRLNDGANLANGNYDLRFAIFDALTLGTQQGGLITNTATGVSNGLFTAKLDFGNQFPGAKRWLEIAVRTNGGGSFFTLNPRQELTPVPYAVFAGNATALANGAALGTGLANSILGAAQNSFIGGGLNNYVGASYTSVSGGSANSASGNYAFIGGGMNNSNTADVATIGGGQFNLAEASHATIGGGFRNTASGIYATVPGGYFDVAQGAGSFAAGSHAQALHNGTFVWADDPFAGQSFASTAPNQFLIRATGGVGIGTASPAAPLHVGNFNPSGEILVLGGDPHGGGSSALVAGLSAATNGYSWLQAIKVSGTSYGNLILNPTFGNVGIGMTNPGALLQVGSATCDGTTWQNASDRALKEHFMPVNPRAMLEKVAALPIAQWDYRQAADAKHIGPMAQDFHAAFGLNGADDKHIATVDEGGVALAAIQGLNQKLEETRAENADLKQQLAELEKLVQKLLPKN